MLSGVGKDLILENCFASPVRDDRPYFGREVSMDSNTYSTVEFGLGMNENQYINIDFNRPIKDGLLEFGFRRLSNKGWDDNNSFIQGNDLSLVFQKVVTSRLSIRSQFDLSTENYELNGGLIDSSYVFPSSLSGVGLVSSDVNTLEGNLTRNSIASQVYISYHLYSDSTKEFKLNTSLFYKREVHRFSDTYSDSPYFGKYLDRPELDVFSDSLFYNEVKGEVYLALSKRNKADSLLNRNVFDYRVNSGIRSSIGEVRNNGDDWSVYRYSAFVTSKISLGQLDLDLSGNGVLLGFDKGSYEINAIGNYQIHSDTMRTLNVKVRAVLSKELPELVFYRYTSQLGLVRENPDFIRAISGDIKLSYTSEFSNIEAGASLRELNDYAIMDKSMTIDRISFLATSFYVKGEFSYKSFEFNNYMAYQMTSSDYRFSLPEVLNKGSLSYNLPLFKHAITIKPGIEWVFYSDYYAMGFHPNLMTYYVQADRKFGPYLTSHVFLNARVQSVDVSLRFENWNYDLFGQEPLVAPNYPGVPRFFQVRVKWVFKN
jgi:hypothetical protein